MENSPQRFQKQRKRRRTEKMNIESIQKILDFINQYMTYLNLGFYVLLSLPIIISFLIGLSRGFKKGIWVFIWRVVYYIVFLLTLNLVANALYNSSLFGIPARLAPTLLGTSDTSIVT